jgi:uncharacterized protein YjaG (DUF416 family)
MPETFDEDELLERLSECDQKGLVTFALACAERLLPNYLKFAREHSWGDIQPLRATLDHAWAWLDNGRIDVEAAAQLRESCEEQAPNTEDFDSLYVSPALDAANAAANVARLLVEPDAETAVEVATFARDTVDMYVQELEGMPTNSADLEERIRLHPMMQRELSDQREALDAAISGTAAQEAAVRWRSPARSNIDLS